MKTKKLLPFLATGIFATTTLVGCSSNQPASNGLSQGKTVGFVQLANENKERIWFDVLDSNEDGEISKDDKVKRIVAIQSGKVDIFHIYDADLSEFREKTGDEILAFAKKSDKKYVEEEVADVINTLNITIEGYEKDLIKYTAEEKETPGFNKDNIEFINKRLPLIQQRLKEVKELDYGDIKALYSNYSIKATVGTDSSGNNVASETVYFPKPFDSIDLNIENIESFSDTPVIDKLADTYYKVGIQVQGDVYKQSYAGYQFDSKYFFITTEKATVFCTRFIKCFY
ncbi:hypothetical protein ABNB56_04605 [Streptococcus iniae]|uniref:hypothetical protein n=1 Tax=Streptococcus iniae TaxID=1346 RepID=UPI000EF80161|nr:hypothetical protein [Streptococcus iniae]RLV10974.1 hypothetical protein DIX80_08395 [Streptococcus iniae]RMI74674.1 hypothetical protein DIX58_08610 [Streptococcus iniae]